MDAPFVRQISKPDSSTPVQIRLENDFIARVQKVAEKSGQSISSAMRASLRLGFFALEESPGAVRTVDAGMLDNKPRQELARIYCELLQVPKDELAQMLRLLVGEPNMPKPQVTQEDMASLRAELKDELVRLEQLLDRDRPGTVPARGVTSPPPTQPLPKPTEKTKSKLKPKGE